MDLNISSTALCRTPLFSYQDKPEDVWDELKAAIQVSSADLYALIRDVDYTNYDKLPKKIKFSCWKYFNRARYRATPFGTFGSITPISISNCEPSPIILTQQEHQHHFIDWSYKDSLIKNIDLCYRQSTHLWSNTSVYPCGEQLRYINLNDQGFFEISSIDNQQIINDILVHCQTPNSKQVLTDYLQKDYGLKPLVIEDLLKQLIQLQLLITDCHPNIIGTDYFKRLHLQPVQTPDTYIISTRKRISGNLSYHTLKVIPEAIRVLRSYLPKSQQSMLDTFKGDFQRKYEYKEVPILTALDPELGVGYGDFAISPDGDSLVETIKNNHIQNDVKYIPYTVLHQQLLNQLIKQQDIDLATYVDNHIDRQETSLLPNTLSAIVQIVDNQIILEHLGGCTANALLGRFTLADQELRNTTKNLVAIEEQANPEVIFFDIGYQAEQKIDNINRRATIYTHELPILTWPGAKEVISLQDIWVSVKQNEVILRSKKYNKRLIPRLATAYNYNRSDLSIYRFLCDIQGQNLQTNLTIHLKNYFPGLDYYPRISYKNVVMSTRSWRVPDDICSGTAIEQFTKLAHWLKISQIPRYFKCGQNDQFLWFDQSNQEDLHFFLTHIKGSKGLYITEAFMPALSLVKNETGNSYLSQYIISIYHRNQVYKSLSSVYKAFESPSNKSLLLPAQDWLYFEIYIHPTRSNFLLTQVIVPYLKQIRQFIKQWFFIRYSVPTYHIRFRIHLKQEVHAITVMTLFNKAFRQEIQSGLVSEFQIRPYQREMERYGDEKIEVVEKCFHQDSKYILFLIQKNFDNNSLYLLVVRLLNDLLSAIDLNSNTCQMFINTTAHFFVAEHKLDGKIFKRINKAFESLSTSTEFRFSKSLMKSYNQLLSSEIKVLKQLEEERKLALLRDLVHMHINRLFITNQRIHEAIIYQYYQKYQLKMNKSAQRLT